MVVQLISGAAFSSIIGGIVDYFNRRDVLIVSNLIRAAALILVSILYYIFQDYQLLFILAVVNGIGWTTYTTSSRALVQEILSEKELTSGNSFVEISLQMGLFLASGASGIVYKYIGILGILGIDTATFIISNLFLHRIKTLKRK